RGITPVMLTGDNESAAAEVAERVGISEYRASLLPSDKERILSEYKKKGVTAMVGDGVNDAPALMAADVGVAVGAGTEVAIDSADVILAKNGMSEVLSSIEISRATLRVIKQNLFWALLYNSIGIPVAAGVLYPAFGLLLSPMLGAAAMSISSVCVVSNSLRLRRLKLDQKQTKKEKKQMEKRFEISVEGMMCMHCAGRVKGVLEGLGAKDVEILLDEKKAVFTASESFDRAAAAKAITDACYKAE
ncbi:MAG: HAD-IC family P-type ATPase, partial [Clostridia bacterium]|nr:HAD-IC family P-type ATPase [Clostridia bacterium]